MINVLEILIRPREFWYDFFIQKYQNPTSWFILLTSDETWPPNQKLTFTPTCQPASSNPFNDIPKRLLPTVEIPKIPYSFRTRTCLEQRLHSKPPIIIFAILWSAARFIQKPDPIDHSFVYAFHWLHCIIGGGPWVNDFDEFDGHRLPIRRLIMIRHS